MAIDKDHVSKILFILSHPLRREILMAIGDKGECSFTDLLNKLKIDTGKLSFHLRTLSSFMEQTPTGKYKLSRAGENAVRLVNDLEFWAESSDVSNEPTQLPLASFLRRVLAFLIDFLMLLGITTVLTFPHLLPVFVENLFTGDLNAILFITLCLLWVYSALLEGFIGQSIGKRMLGLKVIRTDGKPLNYEQTAVRNFGKAFLLPFDLLAALRKKNEKYIRYFDKFAGTTVIDLRLNFG
jgi:uncharacterized RDD family membrane protein YckC/DNA-binding HxlR family transcriptional regulator